MRVYLDHNATMPLRPQARAAMLAAMDVVGNPSSVHAEGRAARAMVEAARDKVAAAMGCAPTEVVFTSGATEAASVLAQLPGGVEVEPTAHDALWQQRRAGEAGFYAMGLANGETGVILPLPRRDDLLLDVTQAIGRIAFAFGWSGAAMAVLSAHKIGGPKGVGALILREGRQMPDLQRGGGQELGRRSGTENLIGIAGFGAAIEVAMQELANGVWDRVAELRNSLEKALAAGSPETIFIGQGEDRLPNTSCFATPGWKGETQVMAMDLAGFAVSAGSACSSGKVRESRVLRAMGHDAEVASSALRVSLGPTTTEDEVMQFAQIWSEKRKKLRARAA